MVNCTFEWALPYFSAWKSFATFSLLKFLNATVPFHVSLVSPYPYVGSVALQTSVPSPVIVSMTEATSERLVLVP